jgi:hypothetical protein
MTLEDIYFISQIIAAVAIVASLIFVGLQIRQSDRIQRAVMHQARADRIIGVFRNAAEPHMLAASAKATLSPETMSVEEILSLRAGIMALVLNLEDQLWQHKQGLLDEQSVQRTKHAGARMMASPAMRAMWQMMRPGLFKDQVETFEREIINTVPMTTDSDVRKLWLEALAAVKSAPPPA